MSGTGTLPDQLFLLVSVIGGTGWFLLCAFARRHWANYWVAGVIAPSLLGAIYTAVMIGYWFQPPPGRPEYFLSLAGAQALFRNDGLLVAAWTDIVLLSLVAGAWIARKAAQIRMSYGALLPLLLVTFVLPGTGLLLFFIVSAIVGRSKSLSQVENPSAAAPAG